jgi:hypothetical protein
MIRPSRHDITRSPRRFNSDDAYVGTRIANVLAVLVGALVLFVVLRSAFLAAVPAISRIVGGR